MKALDVAKAIIGGDTKHGWGVDDSLNGILVIAANAMGKKVSDFKPETVVEIRKLVNPSQFRQSIEGTEEKVKLGLRLLVEGGGRKSLTADEIMAKLVEVEVPAEKGK